VGIKLNRGRKGVSFRAIIRTQSPLRLPGNPLFERHKT
jgi:hypothetical protein